MVYMYLVDCARQNRSCLKALRTAGERTFEDEVFTWADEKMQEWGQKGILEKAITVLTV